MLSTVTGKWIGEGELSGEYWADNLRRPVKFADAVESLLGEGHGAFIEVSAHPVLVPALEELRGEKPIGIVSSLQREKDERASLLASLGELFVRGHEVSWPGVFPQGGRRVELPTYPWQRQRYWIEAKTSSAKGEATGHPLLEVRLSQPGTEARYESVLNKAEHGWAYEHRVGGRALMPGTGLAEILRAAAENLYETEAEVISLAFEAPLVLPEFGALRVQVVVKEDGEAAVFSQPAAAESGAPWTTHASAEVCVGWRRRLKGAWT